MSGRVNLQKTHYVYVVGAINPFKKRRKELGHLYSVKVGVTSNIKGRLPQIKTGSPLELRLVGLWMIGNKPNAIAVERRTHKKFLHNRLVGEWFRRRILPDLVVWMKECAGEPIFLDEDLSSISQDEIEHRQILAARAIERRKKRQAEAA